MYTICKQYKVVYNINNIYINNIYMMNFFVNLWPKKNIVTIFIAQHQARAARQAWRNIKLALPCIQRALPGIKIPLPCIKYMLRRFPSSRVLPSGGWELKTPHRWPVVSCIFENSGRKHGQGLFRSVSSPFPSPAWACNPKSPSILMQPCGDSSER